MTKQTASLPVFANAMRECDVLVIGGGPAGATVGSLLAQKGHKVVVLEKAHHPRFHIGESLLPANLPLLEKLGVAEAVKAIGMEKWAAEFVSPWHANTTETFKFGDAWDKSMPFSFQVRRSEFDEILIRNAARLGAEVIEGCRVTSVAFAPDQSCATIEAQHDDGSAQQWRARFVVDASGRDTVLGKQFEIKRRNPKHNSSAVYAHFTGAIRHAGQDEGNITIFWFDHGWFWFIPLADGSTSIGAVVWPHYLKSRRKPVKDFFLDTIALCPALAGRLAHATMSSEVEATGNFSYACERTHGPNYLLIGDAFAFIDPVFSSAFQFQQQFHRQHTTAGTEFQNNATAECGKDLLALACQAAREQWRSFGRGDEITLRTKFLTARAVIAEAGGVEGEFHIAGKTQRAARGGDLRADQVAQL